METTWKNVCVMYMEIRCIECWITKKLSLLKETISRHEDGVKKRNCIDKVKSGSPKELLWKELTTQTRDQGSDDLDVENAGS